MTVVSSPYCLRAMNVADIPRVSEIERESFPTMWPQTAYKRELQRNNLAAYLVVSQDLRARREGAPGREEDVVPGERRAMDGRAGLILARLGRTVWPKARRVPLQPGPDTASRERIVGFVGTWFMVDEAHIVTIAVAAAERRRGLGELLLIAAIELAQRREQEVVTLECRVSNTGAQALYDKYSFERVGIRKRYYTDNDEDALIMTTPPIHSQGFRTRFEQLRAAHRARWGLPRVLHPEL